MSNRQVGRTTAIRWTCFVLLVGLTVFEAGADTGAPVGVRTYHSENGLFHFTVDPRWTEELELRALMTFRRGESEVLWQRQPDGFEDFHFPMHASISNDGKHLVFGGYSAHNLGLYREGLRFYDASGRLIRYYSRRDLPPGAYSVSTAHWYDDERSRVAGGRFHLFTPEKDSPTVFSLETGEVLEGVLLAGQGDDERNWLLQLRVGDRED